jgi:hypothetical protein
MIACESMMSKGYGSLVLNFKELLVGYVTWGKEYFFGQVGYTLGGSRRVTVSLW